MIFQCFKLDPTLFSQSGRLGKKLTATCSIGGGPAGGPWKPTTPPANLDWDNWLGQAPKVPYATQRCHGNFRWWLDAEVVKLYGGTRPGDHMRHFFDCLKQRKLTVSDPFTHHRTMTSCHLCNLALLLKTQARVGPGQGGLRRRRASQRPARPQTTQAV